MDVEITVLDSPGAVAAHVAALVQGIDSLASSHAGMPHLKKPPCIIVPGGTTPVAVFRTIAASREDYCQARRKDAEAENVQMYCPPFLYAHVFVCDERFVPIENERSNAGMVRRELIDPLGYDDSQFHAPRITGQPPADVARLYEREIHRTFGYLWETQNRIDDLVLSPSQSHQALPPDPEQCENFDLAILGIGADGHTASLFPNSPALSETANWCVPVEHSETGEQRITLTPPCLCRARQIVFVATGESKAQAVARSVAADPCTPDCPVSYVYPPEGRVRFVLDAKAAAGLS